MKKKTLLFMVMGVALIIVALAVGIASSQANEDGKQLELLHIVSF